MKIGVAVMVCYGENCKETGWDDPSGNPDKIRNEIHLNCFRPVRLFSPRFCDIHNNVARCRFTSSDFCENSPSIILKEPIRNLRGWAEFSNENHTSKVIAVAIVKVHSGRYQKNRYVLNVFILVCCITTILRATFKSHLRPLTIDNTQS